MMAEVRRNQKKETFSRFAPKGFVWYVLSGKANTISCKRKVFMPSRYTQDAVIHFYRPCWNAHERGPPVDQKRKEFSRLIV
jgi:hypothetical protein